MPLSRAILGTIEGIPRALALAEANLNDLYAVAQALQDASNAVLCIALDVVALEEGYRIVAERHRAASPHQDGGPAE